MKLKLKEEPREWIKFVAVWTVVIAGLTLYLWKKHKVGSNAAIGVIAACVVLMVTCLARPIWFRPAYRAVMTVTFHIGQVVGKITLAIFFFLVLTPIGLALRAFGKDVLGLRKPKSPTYWQPAKCSRQLDRLF